MAIKGTGNNYPYGQCTWWANERYHTLTGIYVPWQADAHSWNTLALASGWSVSPTPFSGPQIMCIQPGIDGVGILGHVNIVENVINNTTVNTSNMNWGSNPYDIQNVTFTTGPGKSFISYNGTQSTTSSIVGSPIVGSPIDFFSQLNTLGQWISNPIRLFKLLGGLILIGLSIYALSEPDILRDTKNVAKAALL